jgi:ribonuclease J
MVAHAKLATKVGMDPDRILVCEDGDSVLLTDDGLERGDPVPAGYLYVDGIVGDVSHGVLRDRRGAGRGRRGGGRRGGRRRRSRAGTVITGPEVITRGWIHAPEAEDLHRRGHRGRSGRGGRGGLVNEGLRRDIETIQQVVRTAPRDRPSRFVNQRTKRRPMIVGTVDEIPVVMEA